MPQVSLYKDDSSLRIFKYEITKLIISEAHIGISFKFSNCRKNTFFSLKKLRYHLAKVSTGISRVFIFKVGQKYKSKSKYKIVLLKLHLKLSFSHHLIQNLEMCFLIEEPDYWGQDIIVIEEKQRSHLFNYCIIYYFQKLIIDVEKESVTRVQILDGSFCVALML